MRLTLRELRSYINEASEADVPGLAQMCLNGDRESFLVLSDAEEEAGRPIPEGFFERLTRVVELTGNGSPVGGMHNPPPWSTSSAPLEAFSAFGVTLQFASDFLRHEQGSIAVDGPWDPDDNRYVGQVTSFRNDVQLRDEEGPFVDESLEYEDDVGPDVLLSLHTMWLLKDGIVRAFGHGSLQTFGPNNPVHARMKAYVESMLRPVMMMRDRLNAALK